MLESVYEEVFAFELRNTFNLTFERQVPVSVKWKGIKIEKWFRLDILVCNKVPIEIKSVEKLLPVHAKQTISYLKVTGLKLAILINSNEALLKNGIKRIVNGLDL